MVIEFSSRSTRRDDLGRKRDLYWTLGVEECFLMDPLEEYLKPALQGFRRGEFDYLMLVPDKNGGWLRKMFGLWLRRERDALRFVEVDTGRVLPTPIEMAAQEATRAEQEAALRKQETARAEQERARAAQEAARAEREVKARQEMEAILEKANAEAMRLQALLKQAGIRSH